MEKTSMPTDIIQESFLTEYQREKFRGLESNCEFNIKYRIDPSREDLDLFIEMLKKRIDIYNDIHIYGDWNFLERHFVHEYQEQDYIDYWSRRLTQHYKKNPLDILIEKSSKEKDKKRVNRR